MIFLTILAIPLAIAFVFFIISLIIKNEDMQITGKELGIQVGVIAFIVGIAVLIISCQNLNYNEVWNGFVVKKWSEKVHCRHSYKCHCFTTCSGSGSSRTCTEHCSTCYDHPFDVDWSIKDNTSYTWDIPTKDRQGLIMPVFWELAQIKDPTSHLHSYKNYIKAAPDSLFNKQGLVEKYKKYLPSYPDRIYNVYNLDRIITINIPISDRKYWNKELSIINSVVGKRKQCNAILVLVKDLPRDFLQALEQHWLGGNKNDAVLVVSLDEEGKILWADVIALVRDSLFKVELRDSIEDLKVFDMRKVLDQFQENILKNFKRKRMRDFEYLLSSITPTPTQYLVTIILCSMISIGLSVFFYKVDIDAL